MTSIKLHYPNYKMFPYELNMAKMEAHQLFKYAAIGQFEGGLTLDNLDEENNYIIEKIKKLTFIAYADVAGKRYETSQAIHERLCAKSGNSKRQSTRYGAHGIHEYKGKFNPQIVSAIMNIFDLPEGSKILEPFCGSGTTVLEASYKGFEANGFDLNPLASFITNSKINAHQVLPDEVEIALLNIGNAFKKPSQKQNSDNHNAREIYLAKWFDKEHFFNIELLYQEINKIYDPNLRNILLCLGSNMLRDYSQQEPKDLRIRRRISEMPDIPFIRAFEIMVRAFVKNLENAKSVLEPNLKSQAFNVDIRDTMALRNYRSYDAAITSPPYATALPYIDTQRLSIVWMGLAAPTDIKVLENALIGSREVSKSEEKILNSELLENQLDIPTDLHALCLRMLAALSPDDGFRRRAMPFITYRYFKDMSKMFDNVRNMLKSNAKFALVVGHNHTTLGGERFDLDTPSYLINIAVGNGWKLVENIPLETYHRYGLHSSNAINHENLIVLENAS